MQSHLLPATPARSTSVPDNSQSQADPSVEVLLPPLDMSVLPDLEEFLAQLIASSLLAKSVEQGGSHEEQSPG